MRINQIKAGSMLSYAQMIISILISLFYTPAVLRILGQSEYGLYQTVYSAVSMLYVLNMGLNVSYVHFFTKYKETKDADGMARYNGLYLTILTVLGAVCLTVGLVMTANIEMLFSNGLTGEEYKIARVLIFLLVINVTISFPMSTFTGVLSACERFVFLRTLSIVQSIASHGLSLLVLVMGYRSIGLVCVTVATKIAVDVVYLIYAFSVLKCRIKLGKFEKGLLKAMFVYTSFIALNVLVDQVNLNIDKILLARYKGTAEVAIYNVGSTIYIYYQTCSTALSGVLAPRVHKIVYHTKDDPEKQKEELTALFVKVGRIQYLLLGLIATGFLIFGKAFITAYWASPEYEMSYYVALLLIVASTGPLIQNTGITILQAQNKHWFRSILYVGIAVCNLLLSIKLCQLYGAVGCVLGTVASLLVGNILIINIYYHRKANIDVIRFWKSILRVSLGFIIPVVLGLLYASVVDLTKLLPFALGILGYCGVYGASVWLISMNKEEKQMILGPLKRFQRGK